jgi:hypothetical protein
MFKLIKNKFILINEHHIIILLYFNKINIKKKHIWKIMRIAFSGEC